MRTGCAFANAAGDIYGCRRVHARIPRRFIDPCAGPARMPDSPACRMKRVRLSLSGSTCRGLAGCHFAKAGAGRRFCNIPGALTRMNSRICQIRPVGLPGPAGTGGPDMWACNRCTGGHFDPGGGTPAEAARSRFRAGWRASPSGMPSPARAQHGQDLIFGKSLFVTRCPRC